MNQIHRREVHVDWKCEAADVLYSLRQEYGEFYPELGQGNLDMLCENYRGEDTLDGLRALGQDLSTLQYALYDLKSDGDFYCLVLVKEQEIGEFEEELLTGGRKAAVHGYGSLKCGDRKSPENTLFDGKCGSLGEGAHMCDALCGQHSFKSAYFAML